MATRIILKDNNIGSTNPPSGYKFLGYNNDALSERLSNGNINPIGGSLSDIKSITTTLNKSQINNLHTATVSVPFESFDATAGESIIILTSNLTTEINNDGTPFSTGLQGSVRILDIENSVVGVAAGQSPIQNGGVYFGNSSAGTIVKSIPDSGFSLISPAEITGGGNNSFISIKIYYQTFI